MENQEIVSPKKWFCLDEQLREVILVQEGGCAEKQLDLDGVDYCGSKDLLTHVRQNILSNAIQFAPDHGTIHILLRQEYGCLKVSIADNGDGMSEEVKRRVFEKFYQGDSSRSSQENGLGLALVKRIVDLPRGEIIVSSKENKGTTFVVSLPIVTM